MTKFGFLSFILGSLFGVILGFFFGVFSVLRHPRMKKLIADHALMERALLEVQVHCMKVSNPNSDGMVCKVCQMTLEVVHLPLSKGRR